MNDLPAKSMTDDISDVSSKNDHSKPDERTVDFLRSAIHDSAQGLTDVPVLIEKVIRENLWKKRFVAQTKETVRFERFEEFVRASPPEGLGTRIGKLYKLCADSPRTVDLINTSIKQVKHGGDRKSANIKFGDTKFDPDEKRSITTNNSNPYALRRLKKQRPDLHEKVIKEELSVNRAMIEAGFRKQKIAFPAGIEQLAELIQRKFSPVEIEILIKKLSNG